MDGMVPNAATTMGDDGQQRTTIDLFALVVVLTRRPCHDN